MAFRGLFKRFINVGTNFLQQKSTSVWRLANVPRLVHQRPVVVSFVPRTTRLTRWSHHYCTNSFASYLRRRAAMKSLGLNLNSMFSKAPRFCRPGYLPTLALVGFSFLNRHPYNNSPEHLDDLISELQTSYQKQSNKADPFDKVRVPDSYSNIEFGKFLAKGCNGAVFTARCRTQENENGDSYLSGCTLDGNRNQDAPFVERSDESQSVELVSKCLFNYYVESNYSELLNKFWNEALPSLRISEQDNMADRCLQKPRLPPHPNIVTIYNVFSGSLPDLPESVEHFRSAMPQHRYPDSFGRSKTLCLIMKRYEMTLSEYLETRNPSMQLRVMLFTQLLCGILHMVNHKVAHRDLKLNNILLEDVPQNDSSERCPRLVISDFGCCYDGRSTDNGMMVPYHWAKDGNGLFQAPEVSNSKSPDLVDCSKVDLWAAGMLAFEIFGIPHLFDVKTRERKVFPDTLPAVIQKVIDGLLIKDPAQRLDALTACNILCIYLWSQSNDAKDETASFLQQLARTKESMDSADETLKENFVKHINTRQLFDALSYIYPSFTSPVDMRQIAQYFPNYNREMLLESA
ncbi:serine/threonine-protein kinase PINK1, mitochondrial-like [Argonauta hians]